MEALAWRRVEASMLVWFDVIKRRRFVFDFHEKRRWVGADKEETSPTSVS